MTKQKRDIQRKLKVLRHVEKVLPSSVHPVIEAFATSYYFSLDEKISDRLGRRLPNWKKGGVVGVKLKRCIPAYNTLAQGLIP